MILAAGRGERMRPLTDALPKPLLVAGGKPLIVWHIEKLRAAGFTELVINHAHLGELIVRALGDGRNHGVSIRYSAEGKALETAGGIRHALPLLGDAPFLVINGDIFCDADLAALRQPPDRFASGADLAHLLMVPNPPHHPGGDFHLNGSGRLSQAGEPRLTFAGIGLYQAALFEGLEDGQAAPLGPRLRAAMDAGRIGGQRHDGLWLDIGTPQRLSDLDRRLRLAGHPIARDDRQHP